MTQSLSPTQFEGLDREAEKGRKMGSTNAAGQREQEFNDWYAKTYPRPEGSYNATEPGA